MKRESLLEMKEMMEEWIEYRGGMGNRIDGFMVLDRINHDLEDLERKEPKEVKKRKV